MNTSDQSSPDQTEATPPRSLRELRRERTWNAIHDAARRLVQENGLRGTTTEQIAEEAGVSARTFFNYFATKEDAVLGLRAPEVTDEIVAADARRTDQHIFNRLVHMMLDVILASIPDGGFERRRELARQHPEFRELSKNHVHRAEVVLQEFLKTVDWRAFATSSRRGPLPFLPEGTEHDPEVAELVRDRVRASVVIATAVLRYMDFSQGLPRGAERDRRVAESVALFRNLLREDAENNPLHAVDEDR